MAALAARANGLADQLAAGEALDPANITPAAIAAAPAPPDFALREPGVTAPPAGVPSDAATAANFRTALIGFADVFAKLPVVAPPRRAFDLGAGARQGDGGDQPARGAAAPR